MAYISEEIVTLDDLEDALREAKEKAGMQNIPLGSDDPLILVLLDPGELDSCLMDAIDGAAPPGCAEKRAILLPLSQAEHIIEFLEETQQTEQEDGLC